VTALAAFNLSAAEVGAPSAGRSRSADDKHVLRSARPLNVGRYVPLGVESMIEQHSLHHSTCSRDLTRSYSTYGFSSEQFNPAQHSRLRILLAVLNAWLQRGAVFRRPSRRSLLTLYDALGRTHPFVRVLLHVLNFVCSEQQTTATGDTATAADCDETRRRRARLLLSILNDVQCIHDDANGATGTGALPSPSSHD